MSTLIQTVKGKHSNNIRIETFDHLPKGAFVVTDTECQMQRTYKVGELGDFNQMLDEKQIVKSRAQVIRAWESGAVWF